MMTADGSVLYFLQDDSQHDVADGNVLYFQSAG